MSAIPPAIWAIIPVKTLRNSKCRLALILSAEERAALIHQSLMRMLNVLNQVPELARVLVISSDPAVLATTKYYGASVLVEAGTQGLNSAVTQAVCHAVENGATAVLVLPADLPFIQPEDVGIMVEDSHHQSSRIIICSDNKNQGTNALFISPPSPFTFHYGEGSFQKHLQEARRRHLTARIVQAPGLQFDLDTEEDWHKYMACKVAEV